MELPEKILQAVEQFRKIPGIGEKTALRQSLLLTNWEDADLLQFGQSIKELAELKKCEQCGMFAEGAICHICENYSRSGAKIICVVESISDCLAIERGGEFKGLYHILGGVLNPLMGIGPDELKIDRLVTRVSKLGIENLVLALNPSVEGDATCSYIKNSLPENISVDRIGFGIPMGGSLEYLDSMTISKALENRKRM
jgi:recombination protein RecR